MNTSQIHVESTFLKRYEKLIYYSACSVRLIEGDLPVRFSRATNKGKNVIALAQ
ncbi:hypothetical protein Q4527_02695 [Alteromonas stellipolaris]|uniref:Uncharacterized protein n=1 Tax=Alteromonas stellipolaris TaxID=233316 RepID=A0AAW7YX18_9ALTE|nr:MULTISPECIES: hypothetical protein [Alteromonas]MBZ2161637.1 hypothetical protein [Alteromonas stellipolaris]MDO6576277.1 hypothetical protein [Alteromonas stellipolaris]